MKCVCNKCGQTVERNEASKIINIKYFEEKTIDKIEFGFTGNPKYICHFCLAGIIGESMRTKHSTHIDIDVNKEEKL